jgi:uncharacterized membrane protein YobD (UPF0266 family)
MSLRRFFGKELDYEAIKRNGFKDHDVLVIDLNDRRLAWQDRELLKSIGNRLYGKEQNRSG